MALQTSGAISLNDIHIEAGGTTGTQASLNDTDIRGLTAASGRTINSTSGTEIDFADFYGASGALESVVVTAGSATIFYNTWTGAQYFISPSFGTLSDSTFSPKSTTYAGLYHITNSNTLNFRIDGSHANNGWTSITFGSSTYTRASANYSQTGGDTLWYWGSVTSSPFTSGSNTTVYWV